MALALAPQGPLDLRLDPLAAHGALREHEQPLVVGADYVVDFRVEFVVYFYLFGFDLVLDFVVLEIGV